MYLRTCRSFKSPNKKSEWVRKSQIRNVSHLRKVRKCNKLFTYAGLQIGDLWNMFADHPDFGNL
jgi:hypothetical protein